MFGSGKTCRLDGVAKIEMLKGMNAKTRKDRIISYVIKDNLG